MTTPNFTFSHRGVDHEFQRPISAVLTPGFVRANRRRSEIDLLFTIIEAVAGDAALAAIDEMTPEEFHALGTRLNKEMGATPGE